ncbi:DNA mismatch endonuclease Vsr [Micromonospora sp. LH3U1]|uniref:DNA mismatch endonuclease Vsr n=1 Tax=Micromonospora sp. LH3U1 TaxID=3018339 RepID=UPI00300E0168
MGRKSTMPTPLDTATSARLSRQARASTKPELALRRELHRRRLRYRINHPGLPGRPDIALTRAKVAVFVDGCFWHRCPEHGTTPRNNRDWWVAKLDRNVVRDRAKDAALAELGWIAVHVWEHETVTEAADRVETIWRERIMSRFAGSRSARTTRRGPGTD